MINNNFLGVQDMACDTFIKISKKCHRHFILLQAGEQTPFVEEIISNLGATVVDLLPQQIHTFYEAVGYMITSSPEPETRIRFVELLMALPNQMVFVIP